MSVLCPLPCHCHCHCHRHPSQLHLVQGASPQPPAVCAESSPTPHARTLASLVSPRPWHHRGDW
eukprot:scaffold125159_cov27-Tisochrysis_lutea.AAC.1